jgi:hypothetical protein
MGGGAGSAAQGGGRHLLPHRLAHAGGSGGLKGHGIYYYVPDLLNHFTTAQMNALIAPRAHLSLAGNLDPLTPVAGLDKVDAELKQVYAAAGKPGDWQLLRYEVAHQETPEMREQIRQWFVDKL